jgi:hypothetical protein
MQKSDDAIRGVFQERPALSPDQCAMKVHAILERRRVAIDAVLTPQQRRVAHLFAQRRVAFQPPF